MENLFGSSSAFFASLRLCEIKILALLLFLLPWGLFAQSSPGEDAFTETPFWRQALGGAVIGRPAAQVESVVVATDGGSLKSYSWQGRPLWDYYARGRLTPYLSRSREGTSYICRTNGLLIAINRSGRELWQLNLRSPLISPVLIGWDGRLFVFTARRITCMTASGYTLWSRTLETRSALAPIKDAAGGIILVQEDGEILRFDPFGNAFSYKAGAVPSAVASVEVAAPTESAASSHAILLLHEDRRAELIYPLSTSHYQLPTLPSPPVAAVGRKNEAAALLKDGRVALISLSAAPAEVLWTAPTHIRAGELPANPGTLDLELFYDERGIYVLTKTGATGFTADGRRLWFVRLKGAAAIPSFGDDGILYSGGGDWILYTYRVEDLVRAKQRLLYGEMPEGNYGAGSPGPSSLADYYFRFEEGELDARFSVIREAVRDGSVGANEKEYAAWLMEVAGSLSINTLWPTGPSSRKPTAHHRIEAARLLAFIGSRETIPFLVDLFRRESEVLVRAAAAEAIGRIGVDPEGIALRAFETTVLPPSPLENETVLFAVAGATGALCRFSGPPLSDAGLRLLTILAGYEHLPRVSRQAQREIRSLGR